MVILSFLLASIQAFASDDHFEVDRLIWKADIPRTHFLEDNSQYLFVSSSPADMPLYQINVFNWQGAITSTYTEKEAWDVVGSRGSYLLLESGLYRQGSHLLKSIGIKDKREWPIDYASVNRDYAIYLAPPYIIVDRNDVKPSLYYDKSKALDKVAYFEPADILYVLSRTDSASYILRRISKTDTDESTVQESEVVAKQIYFHSAHSDLLALTDRTLATVLAFKSQSKDASGESITTNIMKLCLITWNPEGSTVRVVTELPGFPFTGDLFVPHRRLLGFDGGNRLALLWGDALYCFDLSEMTISGKVS